MNQHTIVKVNGYVCEADHGGDCIRNEANYSDGEETITLQSRVLADYRVYASLFCSILARHLLTLLNPILVS